jgi:hypothetical protein
MKLKSIEDYLSEKIVRDDGCWVLQSNVNQNGYTKVRIQGKQSLLHRIIMEPVPLGMDVDHMCHNEAAARGECKGGVTCPHRRCFNPDHMRFATRSENLSLSSRAFFNQKTCPTGHERSEENLYIDSYGRPVCRACRRYQSMMNKRARRARKKKLANAQ